MTAYDDPVVADKTTLIEHLEFACTVDDDDSVITDGALLIRGDRLVDVGSTVDVLARNTGIEPDERVDGHRLGVTPGFIDTHVHLCETLSRAAFPDSISTQTWVLDWAKAFYSHVTSKDEAVGALVGTIEMLHCGTTCFLDMGAHQDPANIARAVEQAGIRGVTGRHAADTRPEQTPESWSGDADDHHFFPNHEVALEAIEENVRRWNGYADGRLRCWANIEGKESCSLELHLGARELAERLGVGTTYHLASSIEEAEASQRRYGVWPVTRIADHGGLGPNLVLAHAVALTDDEVALLADHGTKVAFCPSTSLKLAKGATSIGKYPEMRAAGVTVGLGTDGVSAAGNLNLHRQMHLVAGMFNDARLDPTLVDAAAALRMATIDGARALDWDNEIGSLEPGKKADFVLWDLNHVEWAPYGDPLQALVWSASPASIAETWVDGTPVMRDARVLTVDETEIHDDARRRAMEIRTRSGMLS